ncbi:hypothetical protein [Flaviaesturariibacter terrae]
MKFILFLVCSLGLLNCANPRRASGGGNDPGKVILHEGEWVYNFKNDVFMSCLRRLYPQAAKNIDSTDGSGQANSERLGYNRGVFRIVDSLSAAFAKRPENSIWFQGPPPLMNLCISYRNSAELDSLAIRYKKEFNPDSE